MSGPRPIWKGALKIALVVIPVKVYLATDAEDGLTFNQLHAKCMCRIRHINWCNHCQAEVPRGDLVKGFEFETDRYAVLSEEDFASVRPASTRVIDLTQFAPVAALDPVSIARSYYLAPDGLKAGADFKVIRVAMKNQVGVGKLAIYGREYLVAVRPGLAPMPSDYAPRPVLMLHTLHHAAEVRSGEGIADEGPLGAQASASEVRLCKQVIATLSGTVLQLGDFEDQYRVGLQAVIDAKIKGQEIVTSEPVTTRPVLDLLSALTASLKLTAKKTPAKMRPTWKKKKPA